MGFFDSVGSGLSGLFGNTDPARAAQIRGGMLGAAQALLQPYSGFGNAFVGAGQGAQQAKGQYLDDQYRDLRTQQLQQQLTQQKAQREALNSMFLGTTSANAPPGMPAQAGGLDPEGSPVSSYAPPQAQPSQQQKKIPGFDSVEEAQRYLAIAGSDAFIKKAYPDQPKYTEAPHEGVNPATGKREEYVVDPTSGTPKWLGVSAAPKAPPTSGGMFFDEASSSFRPIPGYAAQAATIAAAGRAPAADTAWRDMTREEKTAKGLPADAAFQINGHGKIERIGGNNSVRPIPGSALAGIQGNRLALSKIDRAIAAIRANPEALGWGNYASDAVTQRLPGKAGIGGVPTRAIIADIGSLKIHDRSGAAVTASETPRLKPFIPSVTDTPEAAIAKLEQLKAEPTVNLDEAEAFYTPEAGYMRLPEARAATPAPDHAEAQAPPSKAVQMLKMNPKLRADFDKKYGSGAAAKVLGK